MRTLSLFVLGLASQVLGLPSVSRDVEGYPHPPPSCKNYTDNFDDLIPKATIQQNFIGVYNNLTYQAWIYFGEGQDFVDGVIPQSGKQIAATGPSSDFIQLDLFTTTPFGNIIASPAKSFDLYSFYFGCITNLQQNIYSLATGCMITVTGFNTDDEPLPVITEGFNPINPKASRMNKVVFPSEYRNIKNITVGLPLTTFGTAITAALIDNVEHCNYF